MKEKTRIAKIDPETGEEIPTTEAERAKVEEEMRRLLLGGGTTFQFTPEVREQLKAQGMSEDDLISAMAEAFDAKH